MKNLMTDIEIDDSMSLMSKGRKKILLSFVGSHDPFSPSSIAGVDSTGPVLSLVRQMKPSRVILFYTTDFAIRAEETLSALREDKIPSETISMPLRDPIDYKEIIISLRKELKTIYEKNPDALFFVSVTSGTPQMHASWLFLAGSGEFPANILNIRPMRFVSADMPRIVEFDFNQPDLPVIKSRTSDWLSDAELDEVDILLAARELGIIGNNPQLVTAVTNAAKFCNNDNPVIIFGETGTGKELLAKFIHRMSGRRKKEYIVVNCAAISPNLFESELFGHKKGAFTGAEENRIGKLKKADGGTIFLDEIGELSSEVQAKLLRAIESKEIQTVGSDHTEKINVKIIAATNKSRDDKIFRNDFLPRFTHEIYLPSLAERREDIPELSLKFLEDANRNQRQKKKITNEALQKLQNGNYSGNIRDLKKTIENAIVYSEGDEILPENISFFPSYKKNIKNIPEPEEGFVLANYIEEIRSAIIERALEKANGNRTQAAKFLGYTPQNIAEYVKRKGGR